jgi:hypothetical protein
LPAPGGSATLSGLHRLFVGLGGIKAQQPAMHTSQNWPHLLATIGVDIGKNIFTLSASTSAAPSFANEGIAQPARAPFSKVP